MELLINNCKLFQWQSPFDQFKLFNSKQFNKEIFKYKNVNVAILTHLMKL